MRRRPILMCILFLVLGGVVGWLLHVRDRRLAYVTRMSAPAKLPGSLSATAAGHQPTATDATPEEAPTNVYAHNLLLRKGPDFRVYMLWMRGEMLRTEPARIPSFDDAASFQIKIDKGVLRIRLQDLAHYLNMVAVPHARLTGISIFVKNGELHLKGTAHRVVPLPVEMVGTLSAQKDERVHLHVSKISIVKVPMKAVLGGLDLTIADLFQSNQPGVWADRNDVIFDTQVLFPAPHIHGALTDVRLVNGPGGPAIEAVYGGARADPQKAQGWHNFLQLTNGTLEFGKLTMRHVDLIMIDSSKDPWFDLDLINYQAQLVRGTTRMTPQAGLQIFMPNVSALPANRDSEKITMEWLRDRNKPVPVQP